MRGKPIGAILAGICAGAVAGLFGAGGGMVLVPMLSAFGAVPEEGLFPASLTVTVCICLACLAVRAMAAPLPWALALPYLLGSAAGGVLAGIWGRRIPLLWLHRGLGLLILWGGWRYLCR